MTDKIPKLLDKVYKTFMDLMFYPDEPVDLLNNYVERDVMGYGTSLDEKIFDLKSLKELAMLQREQSPILKFIYELVPVFRKMLEKGRLAVIVDEIKISMIIDGEMVIMNVRMSMVWQIFEGNWKLVHWHVSKPEYDSGGKDTWHTEEWQQRNEELQKQVEEKAAELIQKNRELEIEAALERVRTVTMSMQKPDDLLDVCQIISEQLELLNVKHIRNIQVAIIDESKKNYLNYQYFTPYSKKVFEVTEYENNPESQTMVSEMQKSANSFYAGNIKGKALQEFIAWRKKYNQFPDPIMDKSSAVHYYFYSIGNGGLGLTTYKAINNKELKIFKRFHKVFELAYRRFHDIENAEAQAREAQIEAALERVRSRAMAMQKSDELAETAYVLYEQFGLLGENPEQFTIGIIDETNKMWEFWLTLGGNQINHVFKAPIDEPILLYKSYIAWKERKKSIVIDISGDELKAYYNYFKNLPGYKEFNDFKKNQITEQRRIIHLAFFSNGSLSLSSPEPKPAETIQLLERFAGVLEQTYTRFLDLQKAEAQARESKLELSLERIRAQVTAMSESAELLDIVVTMRTEFVSLGHEAQYFWYMRYHPETYEKAMTSIDGSRIGMVMSLPRHIHGDIKLIDDWEKSDEPTIVFAMDVETAVDYVQKMITLGEFKQVDPQSPTLDDIRHIGGLTFVMARTTHGEIGFSLPGTVPNPPQEDLDNLARFAGVFDLAYRRFEDLRSAEQQNRETQIELALEKVRARAMSMQRPEELKDVAVLLRKEMGLLGVEELETSSIYIVDKENTDCWYAIKDVRKKSTKLVSDHMTIQLQETQVGKDMEKFFLSKLKQKSIVMKGENRKEWINYCASQSSVLKGYYGKEIPERTYHLVKFTGGFMGAASTGDISNESWDLLKKSAKVFSLAYTRFRDLQQAAERARETQIELALERVRSKTMAMHNSHDMAITVTTLFEEVLKLGLDDDIRCGIGILEGTERMETRSATLDPNGEVDLKIGMLDMTIHPLLKRIKKGWERGEIHYVDQMSGKDVVKYYTALNNEPDYPFQRDLNKLPEIEYHNSFAFPEGIIFAFSPNPMSEEAAKVFERFARVFGQTYRRYRDLLKAEDQAREAVKQASLDRVRGKIASMRTSDDLNQITPLIWKELETLEVPFIRCGAFIIDENKSNVQVYLTTPDGKAIGALSLPIDANELTISTVEHWRKEKVHTIHWNKDDFVNWMQSMISLGQIETPEQYQGYEQPPESLDLHFIPFKQGMLYVGNTKPLTSEEVNLVKTLAEAFSIAYARYEDFVHLEEAKTRVEKTLSELKSTQSQLIHAEKMASLGELTAGIAHEIQNPLNFVNNFSEVSVDLIDEMNEEMDSGDIEEVKAITEDLKQNLEKIHHHGERASSIVKGMLEHSRAGNNTKESTNINTLADEYLRLAYHGLRAKDKSFNASFKTQIDENLPKIKVVSQDIGRVLLNIINNAFHSVSAKAKREEKNYKPEVFVITKREKDSVLLSVKDNGDGIPKEILDKIFQPFFTTKPSGEGTGLGLSLSYDIITKGHGGELKVITKEKVGTEFIIVLPIN